MTDAWVAVIKDWVNGVVPGEADFDQEFRDRFTALFNAMTADSSASANIWHGHKTGTLAARPAAAHAGRLYYATDLGVQFFDTGSRWDIIGVNPRIAEHWWDEFALSNLPSSTNTTLPAMGTWSPAVFGSGAFAINFNPGVSEIRLITGLTINSSAHLMQGAFGLPYLMDQTSDRVPAILYQRCQTSTIEQTLLFGLAAAGGSTPDGIYFKRTDVGAAANWRCITRAAGVETNTDSGTVGNTAYHDFEIVIKSLASIDFYIDGVLEATHTTNIPSATSLGVQHYITNTAAASKSLDIDRVEWIAKR